VAGGVNKFSSLQRKLESSFFLFLEQELPLVLRTSGLLSLFVQRKIGKETRPRALRPTHILRVGSASAAGFR